MPTEPDKIFYGVAAIITAAGSVIAAWKTVEVASARKADKESLSSKQLEISDKQTEGTGQILGELRSLAQEVRDNRAESQSFNKSAAETAKILGEKQSGLTARVSTLELALEGIRAAVGEAASMKSKRGTRKP